MKTRGIVLVSTCACAALVSGCHAHISIGKKTVSQATVESSVAKKLAAATHQPLPTVHCPHDLTAKVGASINCTLTPQGSSETLPVHVVVTSIANGVASYHIQVGTKPIATTSP